MRTIEQVKAESEQLTKANAAAQQHFDDNRMTHAYTNMQQSDGIFIVRKPTIIVDKVKKTIVASILKLTESVFKAMSCINLNAIYTISFTELQDIKNWIQVY